MLSPTPPAGITRSKSKHELKLLEKIPDNAEATVVLVGTEGWGLGVAWGAPAVTPVPGGDSRALR